jgi:bifunctional ADP-heptose synthase (sugar kinase/adenylyltransferase)
MRRSELSRETPHYPLPIVEERMALGGGANAAANMAALAPQSVRVFSVIGRDWRGAELERLLGEAGIGHSGVIRAAGRVTNAYIKPIRKGISDVAYEDPRLDFASYEPLPQSAEDKLIAALGEAAGELDVLCVSDQMPNGAITERVRARICELARGGLLVVADSRDRIGLFSGVTLKPNEHEGIRASGLKFEGRPGVKGCAEAARSLARKTGCSVFMTLGERGSLYAGCSGIAGGWQDGGAGIGGSYGDVRENGYGDVLENGCGDARNGCGCGQESANAARQDGCNAARQQHVSYVPAHRVGGPIDICGAGDSSASGFALSLAAGAAPWEAACVAGLCSEVTIQQIGATGAASAAQVLAWHSRLLQQQPA